MSTNIIDNDSSNTLHSLLHIDPCAKSFKHMRIDSSVLVQF